MSWRESTAMITPYMKFNQNLRGRVLFQDFFWSICRGTPQVIGLAIVLWCGAALCEKYVCWTEVGAATDFFSNRCRYLRYNGWWKPLPLLALLFRNRETATRYSATPLLRYRYHCALPSQGQRRREGMRDSFPLLKLKSIWGKHYHFSPRYPISGWKNDNNKSVQNDKTVQKAPDGIFRVLLTIRLSRFLKSEIINMRLNKNKINKNKIWDKINNHLDINSHRFCCGCRCMCK